MNASPVTVYVASSRPAVASYFSEIVRFAGFLPVLERQHTKFCISDVVQADFRENIDCLIVKMPVKAEKTVKLLQNLIYSGSDDKNLTDFGAGQLNRLEKLWTARGGHAVRLTEKEVALLTLLAVHRGQTVTRQQLHAEIWSYTQELETHTLETHIYRLRQKIEPDPSAPEIVLTMPDGYKIG